MSVVYKSLSEPIRFLGVSIEVWYVCLGAVAAAAFFLPMVFDIDINLCILVGAFLSSFLVIYCRKQQKKDPFFVKIVIANISNPFLLKSLNKKVKYVS
ncbi:MAG: hypothetical protein J0H68_09670 [Sphingobacteriia bacterium]|nr:hypothetical protein [Sphingobacteriia bacterium]